MTGAQASGMVICRRTAWTNTSIILLVMVPWVLIDGAIDLTELSIVGHPGDGIVSLSVDTVPSHDIRDKSPIRP